MISKQKGLKCLLSAVVIAGSGMVASVAHAALITEWAYTVESTWVGSNFGPGGGAQTTNATQLSWGASGATEPWDGGTDRSGLELIDEPGQPLPVFTNGAVAPTASITHYNNAISNTFATLTDATLRTALTLTAIDPDPAPADPLALDEALIFDIRFIETANETPCGFPVDTTCDDIFVIDFGALNNEFVYEDNTYFVSIVTLSGNITPLSNDTCGAAGVANGCLGFTTPEGQATTEMFGIRVTSAPIPAPGALSVLGLGLLGMAAIRRRKHAA